MATNDTAALVVALSAQLDKFQKDMDNAVGSGDRAVRRIEDRFRQMNPGSQFFNEFEGKLKGLASAAGIAVLVNQIHQLTEEVAKIGEASERVGLTTDEFQKFRYAVIATGGSVEAADQFLDTFSRKIAEAANGTGDLYNFLRVNNVQLRDAQGNLLPLNVLLEKYMQLVRNTKSPQDQLNEAFMVAGRQAGPQVVAALRLSADAFRNLGNEAQSSGVVIDREMIERAKRINTEYQKLKAQFTTSAQEIAVSTWDLLARSFHSVADGIGEIIEKFETLKRIRDGGAQGLGVPVDTAPGIGFVPGGPTLTPQAKAKITVQPLGNVPLPQARPNVEDIQNQTKQYNAQAEAFKKLIEAQDHRIETLNAERDSIGKTVGYETELKTRIDLEAEAKRQNIPLTEQRRQAIEAEARKVGEAAQAVDDYKRRWQNINSALQFAGEQIIDVLDGIRTKTLTGAQAVTQLGNAFIKAAEQALLLGSGPLANLFGMQSNVAGGTGGLFGALFGGFRAGGGPVSGGSAYVVGEQGPELFVPKGAGSIIPNNVTPGQGGNLTVVVQQDISLAPSGIGAADAAYIRQQLDQNKRETVAATISAIRVGRANDPKYLG